MDGLLIDSEPLWARAEKAGLKDVGIEYSEEDRQHFIGRGTRRIVEHWYRVRPWDGPDPDAVADKIISDFLELFKKEGVLKPGVRQTLDMCKEKSLPMAIASSSPLKLIHSVVGQLGITDYFDEIYTGEHEPYGKPHPGVFITVANTLDIVPDDCLVFEDAPSGVLAAKSAKMKCVAVPEPEVKNHPFIQTADTVIDSLEEFDQTLLAKL